MKIFKKICIALLCILVVGLLIPQKYSMPVEGATVDSYNQKSFWAYPWGKSITHKGVDIFAKEGTNVRAATCGFVVQVGEINIGGNIVLVLGPKWRFHYYAHLKEIKTRLFSWVSAGQLIGTVGTTGNAQGKEPHLHYSMQTLLPYFWLADKSPQGWKKMFILNPIKYLNELNK